MPVTQMIERHCIRRSVLQFDMVTVFRRMSCIDFNLRLSGTQLDMYGDSLFLV